MADGSRSSSWARAVGIPSGTWGEVWTDGGLASTAPELARLIDVLFHGGPVSSPLLRQMVLTGPDGYDRGRDVTIAVLMNLEESEKARLSTSERIWKAVASGYGRSVRGSR